MKVLNHPNQIKVGISCLLFKTPKLNEILLIKREKEPLKDKWSLPGGHLELGETIINGMKRECLEETGFHAIIENKR